MNQAVGEGEPRAEGMGTSQEETKRGGKPRAGERGTSGKAVRDGGWREAKGWGNGEPVGRSPGGWKGSQGGMTGNILLQK